VLSPETILAVPRAWRALVSEINGGRIPDGTAGVRDVDAPCDEFQPVGSPYVLSEGGGTCDTDGHYICSECVHISTAEVRRRREQCIDCGAPLVRERFLGIVCSARCDLPVLMGGAS
jgi:hypothetical protein